VDHTVKHECVETLHEIDDVTLLLSRAMLAEAQCAERRAHSATERLAEWVEQSGVRDAGRALVLVGRRLGGRLPACGTAVRASASEQHAAPARAPDGEPTLYIEWPGVPEATEMLSQRVRCRAVRLV
jgi:hypothetical protein